MQWKMVSDAERVDEERTAIAYRFHARKQLGWIVHHWTNFTKVSSFYRSVVEREKHVLFTRWIHFTAEQRRLNSVARQIVINRRYRLLESRFDSWYTAYDNKLRLRKATIVAFAHFKAGLFQRWRESIRRKK